MSGAAVELVDLAKAESRVYCEPPASIRMIVPYRNAEDPEGFAVYRPKFSSVTGPGSIDYDLLGRAFFEGVDGHEEAAAAWNRSIDQSR